MFECPLDVDEVLDLASRLRGLARDVDDTVRVDRIRALEVLKAAASAAQARAAADLDASQRRAQAEAGVPTDELGRGVAAQVALARRDSPHRGGQHLGLAKALVDEMPCTMAALEAGRISEWRATILVRDTACLSREHRAAVDAEVAGDVDALARLGDRALGARARQVSYRLDPRSVVERARRAEKERRVTVRPAPDTMAYLTALLPVAEAVSVAVALGRAADTARSQGDPRTRGQLMADTLVASAVASDAGGAATSDGGGAVGATTRARPDAAAVRLVMTDRALLDGGDEPALLDGYGPVPAGWARDLVAGISERGGRVWLRRLFTSPTGSSLVGMDSRSRLAPGGLAEWVRIRDGGTCRTLWCDAPVRHTDHVLPYARGGPTQADALQGLCEACNYAKEAPGWHSQVDLGTSTHTVRTTTPTGQVYHSTAPPLPGSARTVGSDDMVSVVERWLSGQVALTAAGG